MQKNLYFYSLSGLGITRRSVEYEINELDEVFLAYAASVHKSQGSEYPAVVIPLVTQHYIVLERNLIYTGITRGNKLVAIIGEPKALAIAVNKKQSSARVSFLKHRLKTLSVDE